MWIITEKKQLVALDALKKIIIKPRGDAYLVYAQVDGAGKLELQSFTKEEDAKNYVEYIKKMKE